MELAPRGRNEGREPLEKRLKFFMDPIGSITPRDPVEVKKLVKIVKVNTGAPDTNSAKGRLTGVVEQQAPAKASAKPAAKAPSPGGKNSAPSP